MANGQLTLVPVDQDWKLDEKTKRIGRAGLAQARAVLAETSSPIVLSRTLVQDSEPQPATTEFENHDLVAA